MGSIDEEHRIFSSVPMEKKANLMGDVAMYTAWITRGRTERREVVGAGLEEPRHREVELRVPLVRP